MIFLFMLRKKENVNITVEVQTIHKAAKAFGNKQQKKSDAGERFQSKTIRTVKETNQV